LPLAKYSLWDWAYHGAGAACITNWARAILAIKPENEEMVFRFIAAKRGKRIGDEWENCFEQYYSWSSIAGVLCWAKATADQIAKASASKSKVKFADLAKVFECVPLLDPEIRTTVESNIRRKLELGKHTVQPALDLTRMANVNRRDLSALSDRDSSVAQISSRRPEQTNWCTVYLLFMCKT
jgi:hypothetical protein